MDLRSLIVQLTRSWIFGSSENSSVTIGGLANLHFPGSPTSTAIPYVGGALNLMSQSSSSDGGSDNDSTGLGWELHAGMNFFQSENVSFTAEVYTNSFTLAPDEGDDFTFDDTGVRLGFTLWQ